MSACVSILLFLHDARQPQAPDYGLGGEALRIQRVGLKLACVGERVRVGNV